MTDQAVRVEKSGPVSTVFLHRPARRNAVDGPTAAQLAAAFRAFDADPGACVAVLHGEGGVFCSGADLTAMGTERGNRVAPDGDGPMGVSRLRLSKPVIAAVAGYAVAGGLELALWCDLRIADETAVFGVFCRRWGVPLIDGGTVRLPRLIGTSRAMDMILTGRAVDAQEAVAIGLANRVVPVGQALAAAQELAAKLASFPQICLRSDRASVLDQEGLEETAALASEFAHGREALAGEASSGAARFAAGAGRHGSLAPDCHRGPGLDGLRPVDHSHRSRSGLKACRGATRKSPAAAGTCWPLHEVLAVGKATTPDRAEAPADNA
jgi:enoyl-CoA hydratase